MSLIPYQRGEDVVVFIDGKEHAITNPDERMRCAAVLNTARLRALQKDGAKFDGALLAHLSAGGSALSVIGDDRTSRALRRAGSGKGFRGSFRSFGDAGG